MRSIISPRDGQGLADLFGGKTAVKGVDRFDPGLWGTLTTGAPVLKDAIATIDCALEKTIEHGSTTIAIGRVVDYVAHGDGGEPLIFFRGRYRD